jgi:hypothetical protein
LFLERFFRISAALLAALALVLLSAVAAAKEESKIQIRLEPAPSVSPKARARVRTHLQESRGSLQLRVAGLDAGDYFLVSKESESAADGVELAAFSLGSNGRVNLTVDLRKADDVNAPYDPRGTYLVITDGVDDLLGAWLYGKPDLDPKRAKVKELTELGAVEDDLMNPPNGEAHARYDRRPNGKGTLRVRLKRVDPVAEGELPYDVYVADAFFVTLEPNSAGNAKATFRTVPPKGNGPKKVKLHNVKGHLQIDPRREQIEVRRGEDVLFAGPMLAQINGLNFCSESVVAETDLVDAGAAVLGHAELVVDDDCVTDLAMSVEGLAASTTYDVYVDDDLVGMIQTGFDGAGQVVFDPTPEGDEFDVTSTSMLQVFELGAEPTLVPPVLSGTLVPVP